MQVHLLPRYASLRKHIKFYFILTVGDASFSLLIKDQG
jgi:hypothetical protein